MTTVHDGWLLQSYVNQMGRGLTLWFIDLNGQRHRFQLPLEVTFYATGSFDRLRQLWRFMRAQPYSTKLARETQRELFSGAIDVLSVTLDISHRDQLFQRIIHSFPDLDFYNADVLPPLYLTAKYEIFPLARCRIKTADTGERQDREIIDIETCDDRWLVEYGNPPLRILYLQPECDPFHAEPSYIDVQADKSYQIKTAPTNTLLMRIHAVIKRFDPDLIVTAHGDAWLFPKLSSYCQANKITFFNPCRDKTREPYVKQGMSYHTYGQILHRDAQTYLFGRAHIDMRNLTQIYASGLPGIFEQSRITGMSLQEGSRRSPGAGFSAMQVITALQANVMIPFRKARAERFKSALKLIRADQGGLIGQPRLGIHYGVREFDFVSMYPSIITKFNLSPETVDTSAKGPTYVPQLGYAVEHSREGLIPKALSNLVRKRIKLKRALASMDARDSRYQKLKQQNNAQKSLQTTAFGYMGHKHFKFTQIEVHESITAYSREAMIITKRLLEDAGYEVIHLYVDGIYFKRKEHMRPEEQEMMIQQISEATGLPIGDEGAYKWIIFLPSRENPFASVPNRFFGVFANGEIKVRGIEARTRDTPPYIKEIQMGLIELMGELPMGTPLETCLPQALTMFKRAVSQLRQRQVDTADLVVTQILTRNVGEYKVDTRVARAGRQLEAVGKMISKGMRVRYLFTHSPAGVTAWDAGLEITPEMIDLAPYLDLVIRAGHTIFQAFDITEQELRRYVLGHGLQPPLPYKQRFQRSILYHMERSYQAVPARPS